MTTSFSRWEPATPGILRLPAAARPGAPPTPAAGSGWPGATPTRRAPPVTGLRRNGAGLIGVLRGGRVRSTAGSRRDRRILMPAVTVADRLSLPRLAADGGTQVI